MNGLGRHVRSALSFRAAIDPGVSTTITVQSGVAFRGDRFAIAGFRKLHSIGRPWRGKGWVSRIDVVGPSVEIVALRVGRQEQFACGPVPALFFADGESFGAFDVALPAQNIALTVRNLGAKPIDFRATLFGMALVDDAAVAS